MGIIWIIAFAGLMLFVLDCILLCLIHWNRVRYIKLEEWAEDWLKRLEQKVEAADFRAKLTEEQVRALHELLPKDGENEVIRNRAILRQMNDEMERGLRMEKEWNDGLSSILNYGKPITEVNKNE